MIEKIVKAGIRLIPSQAGFVVARYLASHPKRAPLTELEAAAVRAARYQRLAAGGRLPTWTWGEGPTVALVHGWGGRAAQMAPLAMRLAESGFRTVAFDVAGHGESPVNESRWEWFMRDIADLASACGPLAGYVGHSAGGLAMMAARRLNRVDAGRYVCICAPHHPYPPVLGVQKRLDPGDRVLRRYRNFLGAQFNSDWAALEAGFAWQGAGSEVLLCYDEKDRFIDPNDGHKIHGSCAGSTLVKTAQFGHARILAAEETATTVGTFLKSSAVGRTL